MEYGPYRGLLLPQVPVEWGWDAEEFLAQTCIKAGLTPDMWLDKRTKVYKFEGEIFSRADPARSGAEEGHRSWNWSLKDAPTSKARLSNWCIGIEDGRIVAVAKNLRGEEHLDYGQS